MKRHSSLIPLSREHHDALLLATRLQQGRTALLRLWSHDLRWQAEYVTRFFDDHLARHFDLEERWLFPPASQYVTTEPDLLNGLREEHDEMRQMVAGLRDFRELEEKKLECTLAQFGQILEHHIRAEERKFFPLCEQYIPSATLSEIGDKLQEAQ